MTDLITTVLRERVISRDDVRFPTVWVREGNDSPAAQESTGSIDAPHEGDAPLLRAGVLSTKSPQIEAPIMVMVGNDTTPALASALPFALAGARVYIVAPRGWAPKDRRWLRCEKVLVRWVTAVPVSGLLEAASAHLWVGATLDQTPWRIALEADQRVAFRDLFLRLFWHDAVEEGWVEDGHLKGRPAQTRPFEVTLPPPSAPVSLVDQDTILTDLGEGSVGYFDGSVPLEGAWDGLWLRPGGLDHDLLEDLVQAGTTVVGAEHDLPELVTNGEDGTLLLPSDHDEVLRLRLSPEQSECAQQRLRGSSWWFLTDARLGAYANPNTLLWLDGASEPSKVQPTQVVSLSALHPATLDEVRVATPETWPQPEPLALEVRYQWAVVPPVAPKGARVAPLVERWKAQDKQWATRCSRLTEALDEVLAHRDGLLRAFDVLKSAVMGFRRTDDTLREKLDTLRSLVPSELRPAGARASFERLIALESDVLALRTDQEETERRAREEQARATQKAEWDDGVVKARKDLKRLEKERAALEKQLPQLEAELSTHQEALSEAKQDGVEKKTLRGLRARVNKAKDVLKRAEARHEHLRHEVAALRERLDETFVFVPPAPTLRRPKKKTQGKRFVPATQTSEVPNVPDEALPSVGMLQVHKKQRYLVISRWSELEEAREEAARLGATLVAREVKG